MNTDKDYSIDELCVFRAAERVRLAEDYLSNRKGDLEAVERLVKKEFCNVERAQEVLVVAQRELELAESAAGKKHDELIHPGQQVA